MEAPNSVIRPSIAPKPDISPSFTISQRPTEDFIHFDTGLMGEVRSHNVGIQGEGVNKFVVNEQGKESLDYIIWWNRDTGVSPFVPLPQEDWQALLKDRATLDRTNEVLLRAKRAAQNFYPWEESHGGISVVNDNTFGMERSGGHGVRVSYVEAKRLIEAVKSGDEAKIKEREIHLAASFVHEYIHLERDDFGYNNRKLEIVSHIGQFLYDPKGNEVFKGQIRQTMDHLKRDGVAGNKSTYDMGTYTALVLIADELQRINPAFKELLDNDPDQYKFGSLERITEFVDNETRDSLKDAILDKSISASADDLISQFDQILSSWSSSEEKPEEDLVTRKARVDDLWSAWGEVEQTPGLVYLFDRQTPLDPGTDPKGLLQQHDYPPRTRIDQLQFENWRVALDQRFIKDGFMYLLRGDNPGLDGKGFYSRPYGYARKTTEQLTHDLQSSNEVGYFLYANDVFLTITEPDSLSIAQELAYKQSQVGGSSFISATTNLETAVAGTGNQATPEERSRYEVYVLKVPVDSVINSNTGNRFGMNETEYLIPDYVASDEVVATFSRDQKDAIYQYMHDELGVAREDLGLT